MLCVVQHPAPVTSVPLFRAFPRAKIEPPVARHRFTRSSFAGDPGSPTDRLIEGPK